MTIVGTYYKQPVEVLDYDVDFSIWMPSGDVIDLATATVSPSGGLEIDSVTAVVPDNYVKVWVSGGTSGVTYKVECTVTTDDGRVKQAEINIAVKDD